MEETSSIVFEQNVMIILIVMLIVFMILSCRLIASNYMYYCTEVLHQVLFRSAQYVLTSKLSSTMHTLFDFNCKHNILSALDPDLEVGEWTS